MPKISAILHTSNDAQRIGRALESLRPCDEVVVIDHDSTDGTAEVARKQGATVRTRIAGVQPGAYVHDLSHDWVLSLQPNEALSESLEASLLEWKQGEEPPPDVLGYCIAVREETENGWKPADQQFRLANRCRINWTEALPPDVANGQALAGEVLRFNKP